MRHHHLQADSARRALAVQRALRAAAAVTTTALFAAAPTGCAGTVAPADDRSAADATPVTADAATADATPVTADAATADAPAHPPADAHTVAMRDAGATADGPEDACRACDGLLGDGEWPACTPEYLACVSEASAGREAPCEWACAAWGPFAPPEMGA